MPFRFLLLLTAFQLVFSACSSTKKRDDQGPIAKAWHNTNAHYNGYFNAREIIDESLLALDEQHVDNYNQRLKMFPFLAVDNPGSVAAELDRAIEKVAVVVKKHPYSNWTDDSYLLVGQAQLIKQDYEGAERTLNFALNEFRPRPKPKKGKKGEASEKDEFESGREVAVNEQQSRRDRLRARREAQRERKRTIKQREKERRAEEKRRKRERKRKIRARKKGIRLPSTPTPLDTTALVNEPEEIIADADTIDFEEGPIGMISIFGNQNQEAGPDGAFGSKSGSYLVKHRPAHQEIRLWLAWTLIKRDNFDRAQILLSNLRNDRGTFSDVRRKALAVQAYLYLEQDRPAEAIPFLEAAAEVAEERNERARFYYIAGQLYQELSQPGQAVDAFNQVVAAKPAYELELGARISMAQNAYLAGGGSPDEALRQLERMAKEEKNLEYESQILYSMAGIALRSGDETAGADYLRRALASPYGDAAGTRTEAYQLLGDLAYGEQDYLNAKFYYDSSLQVMPQVDERYAPTTQRRDNLVGVAANLQTITVRDSLLRIGYLPEPDRRRWAQEVFELRRATNSAANFSTPVTSGSLPVRNRAAAATVSNASFWGYNEQAIRRGQRDFVRRWGDRPLEDNWRRANRTDVGLFTDEGDTDTGVEDFQDVSIVTDDELERILADVPIDEQSQAATKQELAQAYFNLGRDYRDRVGNADRAIEAFETLERRFPETEFEAESFYYRYLLYKERGRADQAREVAQKLRERYPDTKYAKLANDPNYIQELADEEEIRGMRYEEAYRAFQNGGHQQAYRLIKADRKKIPEDHPLQPRYALLNAMVKGKIEGREAYVAELQQVIKQYDNTPEQTRAREIMRLLGESGARLPGQRAEEGQSVEFEPSMNEIHYLLVVFSDPEVRLNDLRVELEDYNKKYHKQDRIRSTPIFIGRENETPVLVMRRFKNGEEAMDYYRQATQNEAEFLGQSGQEYVLYPVSQTNYRNILKARSFAGYGEWFEGNY